MTGGEGEDFWELILQFAGYDWWQMSFRPRLIVQFNIRPRYSLQFLPLVIHIDPYF